MFEVVVNHTKANGGTKAYTIYTKEEADDRGIDYVYWKDAEEGDWALSDDNYIAQVIKVKEYPSNNNSMTKYVRTPWGYIMWDQKYKGRKFLVEGRRSAYTFTGKRKIEALEPSLSKLAMCYAQTMNKDLAIDMAFGSLPGNQHSSWKRRMKSEVFKNMVREELAALLTRHGLTEDYTLDLLTETIELAKGKKDVTNLMRAVENLQSMHSMDSKDKIKTTTQLEGTVTRKLLDQVHEEERRLVATRIEESGNGARELPSSGGEVKEGADEKGEISEKTVEKEAI